MAGPTLRRGDRGPDVKRLQSLLAEVLAHGPVPDGIFGAGTESAVRAFQERNDLRVDGVVGDRTWARLEEARRGSTRTGFEDDPHGFGGEGFGFDDDPARFGDDRGFGGDTIEFEGDTIEVDAPAPPRFEDSERGRRIVEPLMEDAAEEFRRFAEVHNEWVDYDSSAAGRRAFLDSAEAILEARGSRKGFVEAGAIWMRSFLEEWVAVNQAGEIAALETEYFEAMSRGFIAGLHTDPLPPAPRNQVLAAVLAGAYTSTDRLPAEDRRDALAYLLRRGHPDFVMHERGREVSRDEWRAGLRAYGYQRDGLFAVFNAARRSP